MPPDPPINDMGIGEAHVNVEDNVTETPLLPPRARDGRRGGGVKMPKLTQGVCARPCRRTSSREWTWASVEPSVASSCWMVGISLPEITLQIADRDLQGLPDGRLRVGIDVVRVRVEPLG